MTKYYLKMCSPFINPTWLRKSIGLKIETTALNNRININEEELTFVNNHFENGTSVIIFFDGNFYCYLKSEYDIFQEEKQKKIQEEKIKEIEYKNFLKNKSDDFYKNLKVPFKFEVSYKDNLSGLSEKSWGDGRKKNTVEHIVVLENIQGKLIRNIGDFLCTTKNGTNGKRWIDNNKSISYDDYNQEYKPIITCKSCLKILKKYVNL